MKLLTKNTLVYLTISIVVFSLGAILFYGQLRTIMLEEANELLALKKEQIKLFVNQKQQLPRQDISSETLIFTPVSKKFSESTIDTLLFSPLEDELLPYRKLSFSLKLKNQWYKVEICHSVFEMDDLIETIRNAFLIILIFFTLILLIINLLFTRLIWKPFFRTIEQIKNYTAQQQPTIPKEKINTKEFRELNIALNQMTERIFKDMTHLKNFTENAAHELQTPLAILQIKTENLLQSSDLNETQMIQLSEMHQTINRLKKINQALIMLTKIENHQFIAQEKINLQTIIDHKINWFTELIDMKSIKIKSDLSPCWVFMNEDLADIVVSNLLNNAIKFCPSGGEIEIQLQATKLKISNSGEKLLSSEQDLFKRFHKDSPDSESTGLGLAIVDSIAKEYAFQISYHYQESKHIFEFIVG